MSPMTPSNGHLLSQCGAVTAAIATRRHAVRVIGNGPRTLVFAHGFGCDQAVWRHVAMALADQGRHVLFDLVGSGASDLGAYDRAKYADLRGHAADLIELLDALALPPVVFIGHSVASMIGVLAAADRPDRFESLVLVGPSPCYLNDGDYHGGFDSAEIDDLLATLRDNFLGWSLAMAPVIMGNPEQPELAEDLSDTFCRNDPQIAEHFARTTFLSDNRADLAAVRVPTLVLQCSDDVIANDSVGEYVHRAIPGSSLVRLRARGHCPHLSAPAELVQVLRTHLSRESA